MLFARRTDSKHKFAICCMHDFLTSDMLGNMDRGCRDFVVMSLLCWVGLCCDLLLLVVSFVCTFIFTMFVLFCCI